MCKIVSEWNSSNVLNMTRRHNDFRRRRLLYYFLKIKSCDKILFEKRKFLYGIVYVLKYILNREIFFSLSYFKKCNAVEKIIPCFAFLDYCFETKCFSGISYILLFRVSWFEFFLLIGNDLHCYVICILSYLKTFLLRIF